MKTQIEVFTQDFKRLKRSIRSDANGLYVMHLNMKAYLEVDRVITGRVVETTIYKVSHYTKK